MNDRILRWGLLSTAHINEELIPPLRNSKRNQLAAVASRDMAKAQSYAREHGIPRAHGSYEALLKDPEIDVVYVSLPNHLHAEWSIKALRQGKHVLCEKPLALTVQQVDAMTQAATEAGRVLTEAFMYRHHPQTLRVQELVSDGAVGNLQLVKGAFTFTIRGAGDIRLLSETGGGSVWDVGCYPISYTRMLAAEEPTEAFGWQTLGDGGVDESFEGLLCFQSGLRAEFDSGFRSPGRAWMEVVGDDGVLSIPSPFKPGLSESITLLKGESAKEIRIGGEELYQGEVEDMADAILEGKVPRISLADSRGNVATIVALLQSAERGRPLSIKH
jgi:xylose dehydrogenase (NAD/NADP)